MDDGSAVHGGSPPRPPGLSKVPVVEISSQCKRYPCVSGAFRIRCYCSALCRRTRPQRLAAAKLSGLLSESGESTEIPIPHFDHARGPQGPAQLAESPTIFRVTRRIPLQKIAQIRQIGPTVVIPKLKYGLRN